MREYGIFDKKTNQKIASAFCTSYTVKDGNHIFYFGNNIMSKFSCRSVNVSLLSANKDFGVN